MATTGYETEDFLKEHIPYRLGMLDTYCAAILLGTLRLQPEYLMASHFLLPMSYGVQKSQSQQLLNLAYETGLITFRLLMEFLGVRASEDGRQLRLASLRGTDFHIAKIRDHNGVALASVAPLTIGTLGEFTYSSFGVNSSFDVAAKFAEIYQQANKTAAHLVEKERSFHWLDNYQACLVLRSLVEILVYERLNKSSLLENTGVWSNTLLHPNVLAEHVRAGSVAYKFVRENISR